MNGSKEPPKQPNEIVGNLLLPCSGEKKMPNLTRRLGKCDFVFIFWKNLAEQTIYIYLAARYTERS